MKNLVVFVACSAMALHGAQKTKNELLQAIVSAHTRAFGNENLIVKRLDVDGVQAWQQTMQAIKQFVQAHASELNPYFATLSNASDQLISHLKAAFNGFIAPKLLNPDDKKNGLSKLDASKLDVANINIAGLNEVILPLQDERDKVADTQNQLTKKLEKFRSFPISKIKGDTVEVLMRLATTLEVTINKTLRDEQKIASALAIQKS